MRAALLAALIALSGCVRNPPSTFDPSRINDLSCRQTTAASGDVPVWIAPADRRAQWQLSRWCETVGPVLFEPHPSSSSADAIDRLAVISWNIHEGSGDVDAVIAQLRSGAFTSGTPVEHFVLLLQEATRRDRSVPASVASGNPVPRVIAPRHPSSSRGVPRLVAEGLAVMYAPSMRNGVGSEDRGNAIVSTLALTSPRVIELPLERQRRAAIAAAVQGRTSAGDEWRVDFVDVHLDTALALLHGGPFEARRRQAMSLRDAFARPDWPAAGGSRVLAGDLNTWLGGDEAAVHALREAFPDTPSAERAPTWRGPLGVHATLDHILVSGATASPIVRLPGRFGSDHFPLLTIIRF